MRHRLTSFGSIGLVALSIASASAQATSPTTGLTLSADTSHREIDPGSAATFRVTVQNKAATARDVEIKTALPDGWRLLAPAGAIHVEANTRVFRLVQAVVPPDAPAREYSIVHSLRASGLDQDLEVHVKVSIRARRSITVTLLDEPFFASSGSTYRAVFVVANHGNVETRVHLHTRAQQDASTTVDTLTSLHPGESRQVAVLVTTGQESTAEGARHHVALVAEVEGGLASDAKAIPEAFASVRVVPRGETGGQPLFSMPVSLSLFSTQTRRLGTATSSSVQSFEVYGSGPVTDGSSTNIDIYARGPKPDMSVFGEKDQYRFGISNSVYSLRVGDQMFNLSPLSTSGSYATGLSGQIKRGLWTFGGFGSKNRWMLGGAEEQAGFIDYDPIPTLHLRANLLNRSTTGSDLGTLYARMTPTSRSVVEAEAGLGLFGVGSGSSAMLIRTAGDHGWIAFDGRHLQTDSSYGGALNSNTENVGSITIRPFRSFNFSGRFSDQKNPLTSLALNPLYQASTERSVQMGDFGFDLAGIFAGGLRSYSEGYTGTTAADPAITAANERSAWGRVTGRLGHVWATVTSEQGVSEDKKTAVTHPFVTNTVTAGISLFGKMNYSVFAEHNSGQRRYIFTYQDYTTYGASAQIQMGHLSLSVAGMSNPQSKYKALLDSGKIAPGVSGWTDATAVWSLSGGRSLSLRVRSAQMGLGQPTTATTRVAYNMPLSLPIGKSRTRGRVVGRVYDAETGAGIANALVKVGDRSALTDDQGRVSFGSMAPSRYPVFVDLGSRQSGGVGFEQGGLEVAARAGETSEIGVRVTHLGKVRGKLQLYEVVLGAPLLAGDSVRLRKANGLAGVIVTLMNGSEERRVISDSSGWFEIADARPGLWRIVVPSAQLPPLHFVQGDSVRVVDLQAGGTQTIELNIMPKQRKILPLDVLPNQSPKSTPIPLPPVVNRQTDDGSAIPKTTGPTVAPLDGNRSTSTKRTTIETTTAAKSQNDSVSSPAADAPRRAARTRSHAAKSTSHNHSVQTTASTARSAGPSTDSLKSRPTGARVSLSEALRQLDLGLDSAMVRRAGVSISSTASAPVFAGGVN